MIATTDYASGLSRPGNLLAFARARFPSGFVATELSPRMRRLVAGYAEIGGEVFIDSGAFSMDVEDFGAVFAAYFEIAKLVSDDARARISIVAPDVVGDQAATLDLLAEWSQELRVLADAGVRVIVPLQKGELWGAELFGAVDDAIDSIDWTCGFPSKKSATTAEEVLRFVDETWCEDVHLLGLGGGKLEALAARIREIVPSARVAGDSNKLRALVGSRRPLYRETTEGTERILAGLEWALQGAEWDREATERNARRILKDAAIEARFTAKENNPEIQKKGVDFPIRKGDTGLHGYDAHQQPTATERSQHHVRPSDRRSRNPGRKPRDAGRRRARSRSRDRIAGHRRARRRAPVADESRALGGARRRSRRARLRHVAGGDRNVRGEHAARGPPRVRRRLRQPACVAMPSVRQ